MRFYLMNGFTGFDIGDWRMVICCLKKPRGLTENQEASRSRRRLGVVENLKAAR
jgi:hypothetical protein